MVYSRRYEISNEVLNAISHGLGFILGIFGFILLFNRGLQESPLALFAYVVYGSSILILFLASTLLHSFSFTKAKKVFTIFDHCAIYILIAGTYTPYALLLFGGNLGWIIFSVIWIIGIVGIIDKIVFNSKVDHVSKKSTIIYLLMGWLSIFLMIPLFQRLPLYGFLLLILGGLLYSIGSIFYLKKFKYNHVLWHCFVIGGAFSMFLSIYLSL